MKDIAMGGFIGYLVVDAYRLHIITGIMLSVLAIVYVMGICKGE